MRRPCSRSAGAFGTAESTAEAVAFPTVVVRTGRVRRRARRAAPTFFEPMPLGGFSPAVPLPRSCGAHTPSPRRRGADMPPVPPLHFAGMVRPPPLTPPPRLRRLHHGQGANARDPYAPRRAAVGFALFFPPSRAARRRPDTRRRRRIACPSVSNPFRHHMHAIPTIIARHADSQTPSPVIPPLDRQLESLPRWCRASEPKTRAA